MASELESKIWLLKSPPLLSLVYSVLAMLVPFLRPVFSWLYALSVSSIWNSLATGSWRRSFLRILRLHSNVLLWEDFIQRSVQRMALSLSHLSLKPLQSISHYLCFQCLSRASRRGLHLESDVVFLVHSYVTHTHQRAWPMVGAWWLLAEWMKGGWRLQHKSRFCSLSVSWALCSGLQEIQRCVAQSLLTVYSRLEKWYIYKPL